MLKVKSDWGFLCSILPASGRMIENPEDQADRGQSRRLARKLPMMVI